MRRSSQGNKNKKQFIKELKKEVENSFSTHQTIAKEKRKNALSAFGNQIQKNQGWSLWLFKQIRSIEHFSQRQIDFLNNIKEYLVQAVYYLKLPSQRFIIKNKISIQQGFFPKQKCLFLEFSGVLVSENYKINKQTKELENFKLRHYAREFLEEMSLYYNIYIFTVKPRKEAEKICRVLDREGDLIIDVLSREHCFTTLKQKIIKDLHIIQNKKMKDVILIDTNVYSFAFNILNGIPIISFDNIENKDKELEMLVPLLKKAASSYDVREYLHDQLNLLEIAEQAFEQKKK